MGDEGGAAGQQAQKSLGKGAWDCDKYAEIPPDKEVRGRRQKKAAAEMWGPSLSHPSPRSLMPPGMGPSRRAPSLSWGGCCGRTIA